MESLQTVDITHFLKDPTSTEGLTACQAVLSVLKNTSCLIIKDPRVREEDNVAFLNLVEKYFSQPRGDLLQDIRPDLSYQLGATPEFTEIPRDHADVIKSLAPQHSAHLPKGPDPKWRFFWRIGERPTHSAFPELNAPPVVPSHFPEWHAVMDKWGALMLSTVTTVTEMIALGCGLPKNALTDLMHQGPHLLAPTGSDLSRFNDKDTVFAGFHYDFNLLTVSIPFCSVLWSEITKSSTKYPEYSKKKKSPHRQTSSCAGEFVDFFELQHIHGKSRFPGLYIWLRDRSRLQVRVPDGCLLLQAGKQLEWLTGGAITAGFHEVVVTDDTLAAVERAKAAGNPLWRVSSTLFAHVNSDKMLEPLPPFKNDATLSAYPPTLAGKQAEDELKMIALQQK